MGLMRTRPPWAAAVLLAVWACAAVSAGEAPPGDAAPAKEPAARAPLRRVGPPMREAKEPRRTRLVNGLWNLVLSPVELPASAWHVSSETNVVWGLTAGTVAGGLSTLERALGGTFEVATFFLPGKPGGVVPHPLGRSRAVKYMIDQYRH